MLGFKEFVKRIVEGRVDVEKALKSHYGDKKGQNVANKLLSTPTYSDIEKLHDSVFGEGNQHLDLGSINTALPDKIRDHVEANGDHVDENGNVTSTNAYGGTKTSTIDKYFGKSLKKVSPREASDLQSELTNWRKNKGNSNTKLVLSRFPPDVASGSTGTHWPSCADLSDGIYDDGELAKDKMPDEIRNGTLIAMHVHKDAVPSADGSYDSKDIIGRAFVKLHNGEDGNGKKEKTFFRERKSYGAFPKDAERKVDAFLDKMYPRQAGVYEKDYDVYDDDNRASKILPSKIDLNNPKHQQIAIRSHMDGDFTLTPEQISEIAKSDPSKGAQQESAIAQLVDAHNQGKLKLSEDDISNIAKHKDNGQAHYHLANGAKEGKVKLRSEDITNITKGKNPFANRNLVEAHNRGLLKLSADDITNITKNKGSYGAHMELAFNNLHELRPEDITNITKAKDSDMAQGVLLDAHHEGKIKLSADDISNIARNGNQHHKLAILHAKKSLQLRPEDISNIVKKKSSKDAHRWLVDQYKEGNLPLSDSDKEKLRSYGHDV